MGLLTTQPQSLTRIHQSSIILFLWKRYSFWLVTLKQNGNEYCFCCCHSLNFIFFLLFFPVTSLFWVIWTRKSICGNGKEPVWLIAVGCVDYLCSIIRLILFQYGSLKEEQCALSLHDMMLIGLCDTSNNPPPHREKEKSSIISI